MLRARIKTGPAPPNPGSTGVLVGMTDPSNNALTINETHLYLANYRSTAVTGHPYHVVTGSPNDASALLDGFTVTGGNANGTDPGDG